MADVEMGIGGWQVLLLLTWIFDCSLDQFGTFYCITCSLCHPWLLGSGQGGEGTDSVGGPARDGLASVSFADCSCPRLNDGTCRREC